MVATFRFWLSLNFGLLRFKHGANSCPFAALPGSMMALSIS
jgi:hypothetical protein